jgi:thioredoxin 1
MVVELTDNDFEDQVVKSELPVLVDFYAPWCGPCRMIAPVVEKLSKKYDGKFKFCKLNVDQNPRMAKKYNVMSIPMLLFFKGGKQVDEVRGSVPEGVLQLKVDALL